jgi:hypothetical protein
MRGSIAFFLIITSFLLSSCGLIPDGKLAVSSEESCGYMQDTYGRRVSWKSMNPTLYLSNSIPEEYREVVIEAAQKWNLASRRSLLKILPMPEGAASEPAKDGLSGIYWLTDWPEESRYVQGVTRLYYSGNRAYEGDIRVNAKYFQYFKDISESAGQIHLESLLVHELGHYIGLKHYMNVLTVMEPWLSANFKRTELSAVDLESLSCEYAQ